MTSNARGAYIIYVGHRTNVIGRMTNIVGQEAAMLKGIFGSENRGKILLYIYTNGESYPREIAKIFDLYLNAVQKQLLNLEKDGVLYSKLKGKVRLFGLNPRYPFKREMESLFEKALKFIPAEEKEKLYFRRLRPRMTGKPL